MAIVYKITCIPTGKIYIGWTKTTLENRWNRHIRCDKENCYIQNCIKKYRADNFIIESLFEFAKEADAKNKEKELIAKMELNIGRFPDGNGMNMTDGGEGTLGYKITDIHRKRLSKSLSGIKRSPETIKRMRISKSGKNNPNYGKTTSKKQKEIAGKRFRENNPNRKGVLSVNYGKIGYWHGKKRSPESMEKMAAKLRGRKRRKRTPEENEKNRIRQLEYLKNNKHPCLGQKRSKASCEKMRQSRLAYIQKQKDLK